MNRENIGTVKKQKNQWFYHLTITFVYKSAYLLLVYLWKA